MSSIILYKIIERFLLTKRKTKMRKKIDRSDTIRAVTHDDDREKVEIYFSCRKLKKLDVFSESDPRIILYRKVGSQW